MLMLRNMQRVIVFPASPDDRVMVDDLRRRIGLFSVETRRHGLIEACRIYTNAKPTRGVLLIVDPMPSTVTGWRVPANAVAWVGKLPSAEVLAQAMSRGDSPPIGRYGAKFAPRYIFDPHSTNG